MSSLMYCTCSSCKWSLFFTCHNLCILSAYTLSVVSFISSNSDATCHLWKTRHWSAQVMGQGQVLPHCQQKDQCTTASQSSLSCWLQFEGYCVQATGVYSTAQHRVADTKPTEFVQVGAVKGGNIMLHCSLVIFMQFHPCQYSRCDVYTFICSHMQFRGWSVHVYAICCTWITASMYMMPFPSLAHTHTHTHTHTYTHTHIHK